MTAEHGPGRRLSAEEELRVTRALRDLPAPPVPPALAARLDARLAELQAEREAERVADREPPAGVGTTAAPVRRRWPRLLLAAAAVLVGGYGVAAALHGPLAGSPGAASSDSAAEGTTAGPAPASGAGPGASTDGLVRPGAVALHSATLRADVRRLLRAAPPTTTDGGAQPQASAPPGIRSAACPPPQAGPGATVWTVRYDGARAFLVTRPMGEGRVQAVVHACGSRTGVVVRVP